MSDWPRESWLEAEPKRAARERKAMGELAPEMEWLEADPDHPAGGWEGVAPIWPFERPMPSGLPAFLNGQRLHLQVAYSQGFPMVEPKLLPIDPEPSLVHRTDHRWHVNGDGSLCLLQETYAWDGRSTAADLVAKAAGWLIEYLMMQRGLIEAMTVNGIHSDDSFDHLLTEPEP